MKLDDPQHYETLIQMLPDIVYQLDPAGRFVFVNAAVSMLGYEPEDLIGKHFSVILHPNDLPNVSREEVLPKYEGCVTGDSGSPKLFDERRSGARKTKGLIVRLVSKDGKNSSTLDSGEKLGEVMSYGEVNSLGAYDQPVSDPNKQFQGSVGIIRDVTEQKKVNDFRDRILKILEATPDFVGMAAPDGKMLYMNPAGREMVGLDLDRDLTDMALFHFHPPWMNPILQRKILPWASEHGIWKGEGAFLDTRGLEIIASMVVLCHKTPDDTVLCYSTISRDIRESKRIENDLMDKIDDLEKFSKVAVARELKMKKLEEENRRLRSRLSELGEDAARTEGDLK